MTTAAFMKPLLVFLGVIIAIYLLIVVAMYAGQRALLFYPSHGPRQTRLTPWRNGAEAIGYCREVPNCNTIWLMLHGNGGQAADRDFVLSCVSDQDSFYVVEYPGYGDRPGSPSRESCNQAAVQAYELLRSQNPGKPVCVFGESLGTGPACALGEEKLPPDKIVLVVPFDVLSSVAGEKYPFLPVRWMLRDAWDNVAALKPYKGPIEIFGAKEDQIIPIRHARNLAHQTPNAKLIELPGGHNDWLDSGLVKLQR